MIQRTDNYDEEISYDNAKAWDAFVDEWGKGREQCADELGEGRGQLKTIATSRAENFDSWFEGGNTDKLQAYGAIFGVITSSSCIFPPYAFLSHRFTGNNEYF
jgi:hypothetical protein